MHNFILSLRKSFYIVHLIFFLLLDPRFWILFLFNNFLKYLKKIIFFYKKVLFLKKLTFTKWFLFHFSNISLHFSLQRCAKMNHFIFHLKNNFYFVFLLLKRCFYVFKLNVSSIFHSMLFNKNSFLLNNLLHDKNVFLNKVNFYFFFNINSLVYYKSNKYLFFNDVFYNFYNEKNSIYSFLNNCFSKKSKESSSFISPIHYSYHFYNFKWNFLFSIFDIFLKVSIGKHFFLFINNYYLKDSFYFKHVQIEKKNFNLINNNMEFFFFIKNFFLNISIFKKAFFFLYKNKHFISSSFFYWYLNSYYNIIIKLKSFLFLLYNVRFSLTMNCYSLRYLWLFNDINYSSIIKKKKKKFFDSNAFFLTIMNKKKDKVELEEKYPLLRLRYTNRMMRYHKRNIITNIDKRYKKSYAQNYQKRKKDELEKAFSKFLIHFSS